MLEPARPEVAPPPFYQVMLLNDDYTPMDFVVTVLQSFFAMDLDKATQVMLHVHTAVAACAGCSPVRLPSPRWPRSTNSRA